MTRKHNDDVLNEKTALKTHVKYNPIFINFGFEVFVDAASSRHGIKGSEIYGELAGDVGLTPTGAQAQLKLRGVRGLAPESRCRGKGWGVPAWTRATGLSST